MRILYVATVSSTIEAFLIPHIELLVNAGHQVDIACHRVNQDLVELKRQYACKLFHIPFNRSIRSKYNIEAYKRLKQVVNEGNYDIIHTHTPIASAITRLVNRSNPKTKLFYTVHGFHFYKGAPTFNWLVYYPIEKILSSYTDTLITINREDYYLASRDFNARRIVQMSGVGLNTEYFHNIQIDPQKKRLELGLGPSSTILLSVGELNDNKNHELVFKALAKMKTLDIDYLICGEGSQLSLLQEKAIELEIADRVHLLGRRNDVAEIMKLSDIFIHPSKREGLPVALMEAMASGLPVICSRIRGNTDLIRDGVGGYTFKTNNLNSLTDRLRRILVEEENYQGFALNNQSYVEKFSIDHVLEELVKIYS